MDKSDVSKPITTTLTGSNYNLWAREMKSFLIRLNLWHIVTGDVTKPTKAKKETNAKFAKRLEDWDSKNLQIITWFRNTSISSINTQFADDDSAKEIWDFLANRYQPTGLAHCYQLWTTLVNLKQESGQSVNDFLAQVQPIWNEISQAKISEDHLYLIQILMALQPEYEAVRTSLLHRHPLPSLDTAIQEIIFEETRLNKDKDPQFDTALATTKSSQKKSNNQLCKNCNKIGHGFSTCPTVECRYCHGFGHVLKQCPMRSQGLKDGFSKSKTVQKVGSSSGTAAMENPTISMSDLEKLLKQVISSNTSTAIFASTNTTTAMSASTNTTTAMSSTLGNMRPNVPLGQALSSFLLDEVVVAILSWVPVKSLLRFRCVCKSWKSLISDPKFVKLHLQRSEARNADFTHLRLLFECEPDDNFDHMYASSCSVNKFIEKPSSVIYKPPYRYNLMFHRIIGSCNGLICLMGTVFDFSTHEDRFWVRLWNPATRTRSHESKSFYHRGFNSFGFGYDDLSNTYKAVVVLFSVGPQKHTHGNQVVKVYAIGGNCWRTIQSFPAVLTQRIQEPVYLNGTLNWVALGNVNSVNRVGWNHTSLTIDQVIIVSLHLGKETYTQLVLPRGIDEVPHSEPTLGVLRDCLCVSHDHRRTHFVVWQMKEFGVEDSWTRLVNVSYQHLYSGYSEYHSQPVVLCMSVNGDVLMLSYFGGSFQAILYNSEDGRLRRFEMPATMYTESAKYYVESLVWPC